MAKESPLPWARWSPPPSGPKVKDSPSPSRARVREAGGGGG